MDQNTNHAYVPNNRPMSYFLSCLGIFKYTNDEWQLCSIILIHEVLFGSAANGLVNNDWGKVLKKTSTKGISDGSIFHEDKK